MEDQEEKGLQDYLGILRRNRNKMLFIGMVAFILTVIVAVKWPATYKSTATILIEQQEIPQDLVRSTVTSYADQRIQVISQRVMSSMNLKKIVKKFDLYQKEQKTDPISVVLEGMRENINLAMVSADVVDPTTGRPMQATIAFTLSFESKSAKKAQQVANELVNLYLNENLKRRTEIATEATSFLAIEAKKLGQLMSRLENKLAIFKEENEGSLPELQSLNMSLMDRTEQQLMETNRQISSADDRVVYLKAELSQIEPNMTVFSETGQRIYGSRDRLKTLEAQVVTLKAKYAANHPDVVKMQKEIAALEADVGGVDKLELVKQLKDKQAELTLLSNRYSIDHPDVKELKQQVASLKQALNRPVKIKKMLDVKPDNPAYIQLLAQLNVARVERSTMMELKNKLLGKLERYEQGLLKAPQVERKYLELTREYDNTLLKFREVKAKQMEADMAQAMEKDRKAERFTLIEPPIFPEKPFKPNRKAIVFLGLILSLGLAVAFAIIKEALSSAVYGSRAIMLITGEPPLVVIPYIENAEDIAEKKKRKVKILSFSIAAIIISIIGFHFLIMPLDVLWYVLFRKAGLNQIG
ncbi:MAG: lipopolysaccharide biosynthesis protein [Methylococcaceae bacterium]|nr:lipopolysaccharide biosynthesis protein [Methylococcaceae bacterium]